MHPFKKIIALVIFSTLAGSFQLKAQIKDTSRFHFQMPIGAMYVVSSSWKPYQSNFVVGLSFMHTLSNRNLSIDWGLTAALADAKDSSSKHGRGGNLYQPPSTGSEMVSLYLGTGQRWRLGKTRFHYAAGISFLYAGLTPWNSSLSIQKRGYVGGYMRIGCQYKISSSIAMGPFISANVYPTNTNQNLRLNPTSLSFGLLFGPL